MRSFFRSQSPRLTSTCGRSLNCLSIQVSAHCPASIFVIIVIIVIVNSSLPHHRQFVTRLIIEKSMIVKWWWLQRQKFIVSWESSKLLLVHSYTFHTFYTFYIFAYTLPLGLLFSIHRQCFLRFQGIARTQGVPNTFMYFHIILNIWCFLHLLTLEILLTFSHFTLFIFLLYGLCCAQY